MRRTYVLGVTGLLTLNACGGNSGDDVDVTPTTSEVSLMASLPLSWCLTSTPLDRARDRAEELVESGELTRAEANTAVDVYETMRGSGACD